MENLKKILKDVKVDKSIDHLSKIKKITQVVSKYNFNVNDNKYVVDFTTEYSVKTSKTSVSFKNISAIEKLKSKTKRFNIGPSAGLNIDGKIYVGFGVNYALFRF